MSENVAVTELSTKQQKAIGALLTAGTVRGAAKLAHISERQMFRWLAEDVFLQAVQRASDEALAATVRALTDASTAAVVTLRVIMTNSSAKHTDRVRAADVILGHMLKVKELAEIEKRLSELERLQNAKP